MLFLVPLLDIVLFLILVKAVLSRLEMLSALHDYFAARNQVAFERPVPFRTGNDWLCRCLCTRADMGLRGQLTLQSVMTHSSDRQ